MKQLVGDLLAGAKTHSDLRAALLRFDEGWTRYEQLYVNELMVIETDARRFVLEAIQVENELQMIERGFKGSKMMLLRNDSYNLKRQQLVEKLA